MIVLTVLDFVIEKHTTGCDQVGEESTTDISQSVLVEGSPRRMRGSEEDGLCLCQRKAMIDMTIPFFENLEDLRGRMQAPGALRHLADRHQAEACALVRGPSRTTMPMGSLEKRCTETARVDVCLQAAVGKE